MSSFSQTIYIYQGAEVMKVIYYDCFCGISGDMNLGAMVDLGVDPSILSSELYKLSMKNEFELSINKEQKNGITGSRVHVIVKKHDHVHRHLKDVNEIIENSHLTESVKSLSKEIFLKIATAEGLVHGKAPDKVHFHEVGAIDSIVDIIGAAICFEILGIDKVYSSPIQLGGGFANCAHGTIPIPAPATIEILKDIPIKTGLVDFETTTPTGAAILATTVKEFKSSINMKIDKIGYGVGNRDLSVPNLLRVYLAEIY